MSATFSSGIKADSITGTITTGGSLTITGANGTLANPGEAITETAGGGGPTGMEEPSSYSGGPGGGTSGAGGAATFSSGNGAAGNGAGGAMTISTGSGQGTASGGALVLQGGTGGATGGGGGNIYLIPGTQGAGGLNGNVIFEESGPYSISGGWNKCCPDLSDNRQCRRGHDTLANYSTDSSGIINLLGGSAASATGTVTLTFNQTMGANGSFCTWTLLNGSGIWVATSSIIGSSYASATASAIWTNGGSTALVNASVSTVLITVAEEKSNANHKDHYQRDIQSEVDGRVCHGP